MARKRRKVKNGKFVSMTIDLSKIKSPDKLAYAYGFFHGISGKKLRGKKLAIATEYKRGFKEGRTKRGR